MYNHKKIEKKWKKVWEESQLYKTHEDDSREKYYILDMFPYPSGAGLHVGHPKGYIATDIFARMKTMQGFNVLHPMGWDAFGLPAENYAIKNKVHPSVSTNENIDTFKRQLGLLGLSYDWAREINTTDPEFYKWTQWIFLEMFKRGLAFESNDPINWCPSCKTGLANEDLEGGRCERCDSEIERKPMRQWVLRITDYADRMLDDLKKLPEWDDSIKEMQKNWIGRSEGAHVDFEIEGEKVTVFTTRPDTLFGATYFVLSPEHPLVDKLTTPAQKKEVEAYKKQAANKSDLDRAELIKDKTGVFTGVYAINPVNNEKIPVWIADYVLMSYGTGAIMAVPAHDERDFEFAEKYGIDIKAVVMPYDQEVLTGLVPELKKMPQKVDSDYDFAVSALSKGLIQSATAQEGIAINSDFLDGLKTQDAKVKMITWLEEKKLGTRAINYKLRDWVFSRQRYWGEPIPVVHCAHCKENIESSAKIINFYNQDTWHRLTRGVKTVETRALNPDEPDRFFGDIGEGDYIKALNKETGEEQFMMVRVAQKYKNLEELYNDRETLQKVVAPNSLPTSLEELEAGYTFVSDYVERINKNGLIAWEVELVFPGVVAVPEKDLPVKLPEVEHYEPTGTGESPLAGIDEWVNTTCPNCGGDAKRETNTMPQWAGSSWYYLRFIDPKNSEALVDQDKEKYWSPVDFYVGGAEHATRHLIYARFWHKFLFDIGAVSHPEPFTRLQHVGLIMAEDGRKMSKRWGNVINPDDIVAEYGADAMRVYEMFMGPFSQACAWNTKGLIGARKFLDKIWRIKDRCELEEENQKSKIKNQKSIKNLLHKAVKKVGDDVELFKFNTAISTMMILVNSMDKEKTICKKDFEIFLRILAPFTPHLCEEIWEELGNKFSIFQEAWPEFDADLARDEMITLVVQVNGKLRDTLKVEADITDANAKELALASEKIKTWIEGREVVKVIYVKGKLVSVVVK